MPYREILVKTSASTLARGGRVGSGRFDQHPSTVPTFPISSPESGLLQLLTPSALAPELIYPLLYPNS